MIETLKMYIWTFFIYSFIGWMIETAIQSFVNKKFVDRGFLLGPVCPIYGSAMVLVSILLKKYQNDLVATFFLSIFLCGSIEYMTSYFMEKIFKARWWDYSTEKYNINGRVCLKFLALFGIGSTLGVFLVNPVVRNFVSMIPTFAENIIIVFLLVVFIIDIAISTKIVTNLKMVSNEIKDNTIEISEKVRQIISNESAIYKRLFDAFPDIKEIFDFKKWTKAKRKNRKDIQ